MSAGRTTAAGRVRSVRPGAGGVFVDIDMAPAAACPRCAEGRGCGAGLFQASAKETTLTVKVNAGRLPPPGSQVIVGLGDGTLLRAALLVYGMPLAAGAIACAAAGLGGLGEAAAVGWTLAGLAAGTWLARRRLRTTERDALSALQIEP